MHDGGGVAKLAGHAASVTRLGKAIAGVGVAQSIGFPSNGLLRFGAPFLVGCNCRRTGGVLLAFVKLIVSARPDVALPASVGRKPCGKIVVNRNNAAAGGLGS